MASWGDALSATARGDVKRIVDTGLSLGHAALLSTLVFPPIPIIVTTAGEVLQLHHDPSRLGRRATTRDHAADAVELLRKTAPAARAVGLVVPTHLARERSDALEVWVEHREGTALTVFEPFHRPVIRGIIDYEPATAYPAERRVWS